MLLALFFGIATFPSAAPIPPLTLFRRQQRVASLRHCRLERIETTNVDALAHNPAKPVVHFAWILSRELAHRSDAKQFEIAKHRRPHGNQVLQTALVGLHKFLLDKHTASG